MKIALQRPLLPSADKILPYLRRIDAARYYSNVGPLVLEFEKRLAEIFGTNVVTTSSATSALTACLLTLNLPNGSFVATPSWSFVATAASIVAAGHIPYFTDIDPRTWITPYEKPHFMTAMLPVCPFGVPINVDAWDDYAEVTGVPVVIDAAAGFDTFSSLSPVGKCPVVISTHATKVFGTGEGGIILSPHQDVRSICNFGLSGCDLPGINAKMSEYHAAVGLASLDEWEEKRLRWLGVKHAYMEAFRNITRDTPIMDVRYASNVFPIRLSESVGPVIEKMNAAGVPCRSWTPVHRMKVYADYPRTAMPVTDALADTVMLLPFSIDQTSEEIDFIREKLVESMV